MTRDTSVNPGPNNDRDTLYVIVQDMPCKPADTTTKANGKPEPELANTRWLESTGAGIDCGRFKKEELVSPGDVYTVGRTELLSYGVRRFGWAYGALIVPFKYHFDDKSVGTAVTIGPYLGYRFASIEWDLTPIVSVGLASVPVPNPDGSDTSNAQGLTVAIGVLFNVTKNQSPLRVGIVFGQDRVGSNAAVPYKHEGKTWVAAQIGFDFSK